MNSQFHPAQARRDITPIADPLYVVTALENPLRWASRYRNYWSFHKHVQESGAHLVTVELAYGDRAFECTSRTDPWSVQLRCEDELFHKENLLNLGMHRLPDGAKYVAFVDADMMFTRQDWVQETLHQLQHFQAVQMFSNYSDLGPDHQASSAYPAFMWSAWNDPNRSWLGAPGGAWAFRISALRTLGGLMDRCILGSADHHMALGLIGREEHGLARVEMTQCSDAYHRYIWNWQQNAKKLNYNVGYVDAHMVHWFHGPRRMRGYDSRWKILQGGTFDPWRDLRANQFGVYELTEEQVGLRNAVRRYLRARDEDASSDAVARNIGGMQS